MSPPQQLRQQTSNCSSLLIYRPRKDERLSWPSWLTYSGWLTRISGHPSAASRAQDSERTPAKDRCSTAGLYIYFHSVNLKHIIFNILTLEGFAFCYVRNASCPVCQHVSNWKVILTDGKRRFQLCQLCDLDLKSLSLCGYSARCVGWLVGWSLI